MDIFTVTQHIHSIITVVNICNWEYQNNRNYFSTPSEGVYIYCNPDKMFISFDSSHSNVSSFPMLSL